MTEMSAQSSISGTVMGSDGNPVPFAVVSIINSQANAMAGPEGKFQITKVPNGQYILLTRCFGYLDHRDTLQITGETIFSPVLIRSTKQLDEIVVNASRVDDHNGMAYSNISAETIQKQNLGQDAPYILNTLPNVVVNSDAGNGVGYTGMRVRGSDPTRVNVTINGVPVNDAESQGTFWVDFPDLLSSTNNVQLQRGVGTSANGAGAFGASLNFQTNALHEKPYGQVISTAGSFGTIRNSVMAGTGLINKKFSIDGRASKILSNGYIDRASSNLGSYYLAAGFYMKKSVIKFITFSGSEKTYQAWNYVPEDSVKAGNRTYNSCGEYVDANGQTKYYSNETDNYYQGNYQLHFIHTFNSRINLNVTAHYTKGKGYYEQYKQAETLADYGLTELKDKYGNTISSSNLIRRLWLDNDFAGGVFNLYYKYSSKLAFTLGGGYNTYFGKHFGQVVTVSDALNTNVNQQYGMNTANKNDGNLYLKTNYQINRKGYLFVDLQARAVAYSFLGFNDSLATQMQNAHYFFFNPKVGYSYEFNNDLNFYASISRANKEPNRDDFVQSSKNSRPKAEQLTDVEAGFKYKKKTWLINANFYDMEYKNQLVLNGKINNVGSYNRVNVAASYRRGLELEIQKALGKKLSIGGNLSLSSNKIKNFVEYLDSADVNDVYYPQHENKYKLTNIAFSPSSVAAILLGVKPIKGLEITLTRKFVGRQYLDNTSQLSRSIDPYAVLDLRLNYSVKTKFIPEIGFMLSVYNVLNKQYETNGYTYSYYYGSDLNTANFLAPAAPINFLGGISLKF